MNTKRKINNYVAKHLRKTGCGLHDKLDKPRETVDIREALSLYNEAELMLEELEEDYENPFDPR